MVMLLLLYWSVEVVVLPGFRKDEHVPVPSILTTTVDDVEIIVLRDGLVVFVDDAVSLYECSEKLAWHCR